MTATLGYARVSTTAQDLDTQLDALTAAGVDPSRVFTDTLSGAAGTHRPGLAKLLAEKLDAPCHTLEDLRADTLYQTVLGELDNKK